MSASTSRASSKSGSASAPLRHGNPDRVALDELSRLIQSVKLGKLTDRAATSAAANDSEDILSCVNALLDAVLLPIGEGNRVLDQIAREKSTRWWSRSITATTRR